MENKKENFIHDISDGSYLVEFSAPWCRDHKAHEFFEYEAPSLFHLGFRLCDVDKNPQVAAQLGVFSLPTWILFENGHEVDRFVGFEAKKKFLELTRTNPDLEFTRLN